MPIFLVRGVADALRKMKGPVILIANLLTEGRGMAGFTAADAVSWIEQAIERPVDVVITNTTWPSPGCARSLRRRAQAAARDRHAAVPLRGGERRVLVRRHRAPRPPPPGLRGVERALAAPACLSHEGTKGTSRRDRGISASSGLRASVGFGSA